MKEEKYYCDRCGKEINKPKEFGGFFSHSGIVKCSEIKHMIDYNSSLTDALETALNSNDIDSISLYYSGRYSSKDTTYELCRKCESDFIKFMRNER